jgi:hypothetical protein
MEMAITMAIIGGRKPCQLKLQQDKCWYNLPTSASQPSRKVKTEKSRNSSIIYQVSFLFHGINI